MGSHCNIAAQMFTVREFTKTPAGIAAACARIRKIGFEAIQISAFGPADPREIAAILKNEGLACCATHTAYDRMVNDTARLAEEHALWGCRHTAIGAIPAQYKSAEGYVAFAKEASAVGRKLRQHGLTLSYHNHAFELERFGKRTGLGMLMEESSPADLCMEIDTYWIQYGGGDPAEWVRRCARRIPLLHLKDMQIADDKPRMAEVGEGNLNWPAIISAARDAGVEWYIIEQDVCQRDPFESLKISLENLRGMLAGAGDA